MLKLYPPTCSSVPTRVTLPVFGTYKESTALCALIRNNVHNLTSFSITKMQLTSIIAVAVVAAQGLVQGVTICERVKNIVADQLGVAMERVSALGMYFG